MITLDFFNVGGLRQWSSKRVSNPWPPPWQGGVLPTELLLHICGAAEWYRTIILWFFRPMLRPHKLQRHVVGHVGFEPTTFGV